MKRYAIVLLAIPALSGCRLITVPEIYPYPFNANSGDVVNVIMNPEGDIFQRCMDMGGQTLDFDSATAIYTCTKVDF